MLDFLVIGSGPVGAAIGRTLRRAGKEFRILSPEESLFSEWDRKSSNTGMKYLRSPIAHDLSLYRDFTLEDYIRTHHSSRASPEPAISSLPGFINPLFRQRARTDIWNAYCADFARRFSLEQEVLRGQAQAIYRTGRRFLVETDAGQIDARNLALCLGTVSAPRWPAWARSLRQQGADVAHLFDPGFRSSQGSYHGERVVVVGGGISAGQAAHLASAHSARTVLLSREPLEEQAFDGDPAWTSLRWVRRQIGKHRLLELLSFGKYSRAPALEQGEYPGTVPYDVKRDLRLSLVGEKRGEVADASVRQSTGTLALHLYDGRELLADRVRLATGYEHAATHPLLAQASEELGLPRWQENGFPRLDDRTLEWRGGTGNGRIYVAGHAAKMSLGPFGGNFRGAQFASELLATAIGLAPYR